MDLYTEIYTEIRGPNRLVDDDGQRVKLKPGAEIDVKIEADPLESTVELEQERK